MGTGGSKGIGINGVYPRKGFVRAGGGKNCAIADVEKQTIIAIINNPIKHLGDIFIFFIFCLLIKV